MYPKLVKIKNIRGIKDLSFIPSSITIVSGKNGAGKSSIAASIVYLGELTHDPTMLRQGCDKGSIELVIGDPSGEFDGARYVCTVTEDTSTRVLHHPKLGKIPVSKSKEWFRNIVNMVSLDPTRFINADSDDQLKMFLQVAPLYLTADQLAFMPTDIVKHHDLSNNALDVIGGEKSGMYGELYEIRKNKNLLAKDKRATARTTSEGLPDDPPEGEWAEVYHQKNLDLASLRSDTQIQAGNIRNDARRSEEALKKLFEEQKNALNQECADKSRQLEKDAQAQIDAINSKLAVDIKKIVSDTEIALSIEESRRDASLKEVSETETAAMEAAKIAYDPKNEALLKEITTAKNMIDAHAKAQSSKELIGKMNAEAEALEAESKTLTEQMSKLDGLKVELLKTLPIPGMSIKEGMLYDGEVPFKSTNSAEQYRIMFEMGKLLSGPMGFMVMDNAELLDDQNWNALTDAAAKSGMKVIAMRRTEGPLSIETEVA